MKKFGNYVVAASLVFSAAVFGASLIEQVSAEKQVFNAEIVKVDAMGNVISH